MQYVIELPVTVFCFSVSMGYGEKYRDHYIQLHKYAIQYLSNMF